MKATLVALIPLLSALAVPGKAQTQAPGGQWTNLTRGNGGGVRPGRGFAVPFFYYPEREVVVVEKEVIREVPAAPPPEPPPPPRKPYVIGASYSSLPGGCMKQIEAGAAFFYCSGDWYRQVGKGYLAVKSP